MDYSKLLPLAIDVDDVLSEYREELHILEKDLQEVIRAYVKALEEAKTSAIRARLALYGKK